jgi:hypothetical protein
VFGEFGDDQHRYRQQGPQELRRHLPDHPGIGEEDGGRGPFIHNDRLADALNAQVR